MTTYKGETLEPRYATKHEQKLLNNYLECSARMKEFHDNMYEVLNALPQLEPLVANIINEDGEEETRTFIVDKPSGHYVYYKNLELAMNTKTTKADLKSLS